MQDISELDASLKLKALGRLDTTNHPMLCILRTQIKGDFFYPSTDCRLDGVISKGIELLRIDRQSLWAKESLYSNRAVIKKVKEIKLTQALSANGRNSLTFAFLRNQRKLTIGDLNPGNLRDIARFINPNLLKIATQTMTLNPGRIEVNEMTYFVGSKLTTLGTLTSKQIRTCRTQADPICISKLGPILTPIESINLFSNLSKLTNTRHKDILLRLIHGELYSKVRLHKYGLVAHPTCPRCNELETLRHKYLECEYIKEIWKKTSR